MSRSKSSELLRALVHDAWAKLERAAERNTETGRLLYQAFQAAREGEAQHRRGTPSAAGQWRYSLSVDDTARMFVVRWFALHEAKPTTLRAAASLRQDVLYAGALREAFDAEGRNPFTEAPGAAFIDYAEQVSLPPKEQGA